MFYKVDYAIDDSDPLQKTLNRLYGYRYPIVKLSHRKRMNLFHDLLRTLIKDRAIESFDTALDIGCGAGTYSRMLRDFGFKSVLGIDLHQEALDRACAEFQSQDTNLSFQTMNAEELDTRCKYDFILCTEVIEHTENPHKVVKNIKESLAPGGVAVITLPNLLSLPYFTRFIFYKIARTKLDREKAEHLRYPFYRSLKLFRDDGFEIIKTSGTNLVFVVPFAMSHSTLFTSINRADSYLSTKWPLKYFAQFFFMVVKKHK